MSNNYSQPPKWDPKDPAGSAKAYADWLQGQSGGGATNQASAGGEPKDKPANFTVLDPASGGTTWLDPIAHTTWQMAQGTNGKPYVGYANAAEVDRIMGAGTSAKQASDAAAAKQQSVPDPPAGFKYITGTDKAYAPPAPGSKATALGSTAFYNTTTGKWSVYNATASDLALVKSQGLGTTPPATTTQPAAAGAAATTQPAAGQPAGAPPAAPPALNAPPVGVQSPYAQTQAATKSIVTPQSTGLPQQSVTVPNTYQGGPSGFQSVMTPQGQQNMAVPHEFSFGPANFNPAVTTGAPVPPAAQIPPARVDPLAGPSAGPPPGTSAGLLPGTRPVGSPGDIQTYTGPNIDPRMALSPGALGGRPNTDPGLTMSAPGVTPGPATPQGVFRPPNVGDAGLANFGATGPAPTGPTGGVDLSQYGGAWLPDGSAWFPIQGGKTVGPDAVALIERTWADSPGNIPTMLGIAARESQGNATAVGVNGPGTGAPGTRDAGLLQINENNWPSLGLTAQSVLNPETNVAAARTLFDRSQGAGPWGGPDIYNPVGYSWAQHLQSGTPPPNALGPIQPGPITGQVAQGFTPPGAPPPPAGPGPNTTPGPDGRTGNDWTTTMQNRGILPGGGGGTPPAGPGGGGGGGSWGGPPIPAGTVAPPVNRPPATDMWQNMLNGTNALTGMIKPPGLYQGMINGANNILQTYNPANAGAADTGPAAPPAVPQTNMFYSGPQSYAMSNNGLADRIGGLNGATGYNPQVVLAGNGIKSTGDANLDATIAAQLIQKQNAMGANAGFADPLANRSVGAAGTFQSPLSGPLMNEQRTDHGFVFSPGNINSGESIRSPMNSGMYTPVMTPQGVVLTGANGAASPAAQAVAYQQAGYGPRPLGADRQPDVTQAPYMMSPTSNVGAVIQAAAAQQAQPQLSGLQFTGGANLAGANPNSNLGPTPVGYDSAANLPSPAQLQMLGQANQDPLAGNTDFQNAGGAAGGDRTQYFAGGGNFSLDYGARGPVAPPTNGMWNDTWNDPVRGWDSTAGPLQNYWPTTSEGFPFQIETGGGINSQIAGPNYSVEQPSGGVVMPGGVFEPGPDVHYMAGGGGFSLAPQQDDHAGGISGHLGGISGGYGGGTPQRFNLGSNGQGGVDPASLERALQQIAASSHTGYIPQTPNPAHPMMLARGGNFITTQPTMFPMRGGGTAETSEYGQPELINQHGSRVKVTPMTHASNMSPLRGYALGGSFNTTTQGNSLTIPHGTTTTEGGDPLAQPGPTSTTPGVADPTTEPGTQVGLTNPDLLPADSLPPPPPLAPVTPTPPPDTTPQITQGPAAAPVSPYLNTGPEVGVQTGIANQASARANRNYLYSAAGVAAPVGITSNTPLTNLAPNQFWQPVDYTSEIQSRQNQLAALAPNLTGPDGQPLDPNSLIHRQDQLKQMLGTVWGSADSSQYPDNGGEAGTNDPVTGQWMWQSQIEAEMARNALQSQQIQQANQLQGEITNLRANQPAITAPAQPQMSANTSAAQLNAPPTPATSPNLGIFLNALGDQSNSGKARRVDPMAGKAA